MNETPPIVADEDAKLLREMARKVRFIAGQAVSDRTRRVLVAMADEYELRAAQLEIKNASGPSGEIS